MSERGEMQGVIIHSLFLGLRQHLSSAQVLDIKAHLDAARGPGTFARLEGMRRLAWVSADDYTSLVKATWDVLGESAYLAFWRKMGSVFLESAFATVLKGFQTAFGVGPVTVLRAMCVIWGMVTRHCGKFTFRESAAKGEATLLFEAPPAFVESWFAKGLAEGLAVTFDLAGVRGQLVPVHSAAGRVELQARWS